MTSANLKLKYATAAFAVVLFATAAVIGLFAWRHPPDLLTVQGVSALAVLGALAAAVLAWRAARGIHFSTAALIRSAERVGQGDYTRPVEVRRRDILGELEQALERMRARLRQSTINKNYLHSVLNSMTDAVFVTSPDGVIKVANSAACKLLGYSEEELLGTQHHRDPR